MFNIFGVVAIVFAVAVPVSLFAFWIYGLVLGFTAHVVIGVVFIVLPPLPTVTGIAQFFFHYNIAERLSVLF